MVHAQDALAPRPAAPFRDDLGRYAGLPFYIFGLGDTGGEAQMLSAFKPGWVVIGVQVSPPDSTGDFDSLAEQGLGVIVRLENGPPGAGTLPLSTRYEEFAQLCADFVAQSSGARLWVVGNEPNSAVSRPGYDGTANSGEVISPEMYARVFNRCREAIRGLRGHEHDWVIPAAVAPFNTQTNYPTNPTGDWVRYFADLLFQIVLQGGRADALALHAFTHGSSPALIASEARAAGKFSHRRWHFRTYRDQLAAVTPAMRHLPVLLTAAAPLEPGWNMQASGWIQAACAEINEWNQKPDAQPIQAVCFQRWRGLPGDPPGGSMADKPSVVEDFCAALQNDYRVRWPLLPPAPDYRAQWLSQFTPSERAVAARGRLTGRLSVRNIGARPWLKSGPFAVRLGWHWTDLHGAEIPVDLLVESEPTLLPRDVLPGQAVTLDPVVVSAPRIGGAHVVRFDLCQEGGEWFGAAGSLTLDWHVTVLAPALACEWLDVPALGERLAVDETRVESIRLRNLGTRSWAAHGPHALRLAYRWYDLQGQPVALPAYPGDQAMAVDVAPGQAAAFEQVTLCAPPRAGRYTLRLLIKQGEAELNGPGIERFEQQVEVIVPLPEFAVEWLDSPKVPALARPNELIRVAAGVRNAGSQAWNASGERAAGFRFRWYDAQGEQVAGERYQGMALPARDVAPGGTAVFRDLVVHAPVPPGEYRLILDVGLETDTSGAARGGLLQFPVTVRVDAPAFSAAEARVPEIPEHILRSGQVVSGRVQVTNDGAAAWPAKGEDRIVLQYHWYTLRGERVELPGYPGPFALLHEVLPGEEGTFEAVKLCAPETPGKYGLRWYLARGQDEWLPITEPSPPIQIKTPRLEWAAEFVAHNIPPSQTVGQHAIVTVQVLNSGRNVWPSKGERRVSLAARWYDSAGEPVAEAGPAFALENGLASDARLEFTTELVAPPQPGTYTLVWDVYREGAGSFSEGGSTPLRFPVKVTAQPSGSNLWRAEASHAAGDASHAIDGDLSTCWSSQEPQAAGMWFLLSLPAPLIVDGLAFRSPGSGYPYSYALSISADGETWRPVARVGEGNRRDVVASFAPGVIQYARLELLRAWPDDWQVAEALIHTSPGWSATASIKTELTARALDNDPVTAWTTGEIGQKPDQWFQLDLHQEETVSGLELDAVGAENPVGYRVTVWNEAAGGWQKLAERRDNLEPVALRFAPVRTRYLNIQLVEATDRAWSIREVRVERVQSDWISPG